MLEPGTFGDEWQAWKPYQRDYAGMKRWIKGLASKFDIKPLASVPVAGSAGQAAQNLHEDNHLNAPLPLVAG